MINQKKVRIMSKMAMLESGLGEKELRIASYKGFDYVLLQIVKGFFVGTLCFAAVFLFWFCMQWDDLNILFADADFIGFFYEVIDKYAIFIIAYLILCGIVGGVRYHQCSKRKMKYMQYMKLLKKTDAPVNEPVEEEV